MNKYAEVPSREMKVGRIYYDYDPRFFRSVPLILVKKDNTGLYFECIDIDMWMTADLRYIKDDDGFILFPYSVSDFYEFVS